MATTTTMENEKCWRGCGAIGTLGIAAGDAERRSCCGRPFGRMIPTMLLLGVHAGEPEVGGRAGDRRAALFAVAIGWRQPRCSSTNERVTKCGVSMPVIME